jgi:hypothetical protein
MRGKSWVVNSSISQVEEGKNGKSNQHGQRTKRTFNYLATVLVENPALFLTKGTY